VFLPLRRLESEVLFPQIRFFRIKLAEEFRDTDLVPPQPSRSRTRYLA